MAACRNVQLSDLKLPRPMSSNVGHIPPVPGTIVADGKFEGRSILLRSTPKDTVHIHADGKDGTCKAAPTSEATRYRSMIPNGSDDMCGVGRKLLGTRTTPAHEVLTDPNS